MVYSKISITMLFDRSLRLWDVSGTQVYSKAMTTSNLLCTSALITPFS